MSVRSPVIAHDNVFNREVCEGGALFFSDASDLARKMDSLESNEQMRNQLGSRAREIASTRYRWDAVVDSYDELFLRA
jgi:rhamnosyltransferase